MSASIMRFKPTFYPVNWTFIDPDTGYKFHGKSKESLIKHIVTYRSQNELPEIEHLETVLENYWCSLPENKGGCARTTLKRGTLAYLKGGISLFKTVLLDRFAAQAEADRRSTICSKCPFNEFPDKTTFVEWADKIAVETIGNRRSTHHDSLGNCAGCGCPLRSKVFVMPPFKLKKTEEVQMRRANNHCWQLPENIQSPKPYRDSVETTPIPTNADKQPLPPTEPPTPETVNIAEGLTDGDSN